MPENALPALAAALGLAVLHIVAGRLMFLQVVPRSRWLSLAGGVAVAYVFVHLLPELAEHQARIQAAGVLPFLFLERHVYLVALVGLAFFYGLERLAKSDRQARAASRGEDATSAHVFWIHIGSFTLYNALIGYILVHREDPGLWSLAFFTIAMGLHFLINDFSLREHHKAAYHRTGRWVLAGAIVVGWGIGLATDISPVALAVLVAFLAGGVILNVLKEELPEEQQSRFWAFAVGAAVYAAILIAI